MKIQRHTWPVLPHKFTGLKWGVPVPSLAPETAELRPDRLRGQYHQRRTTICRITHCRESRSPSLLRQGDDWVAGSNEGRPGLLKRLKTKLLLPKAVVREAGPNCGGRQALMAVGGTEGCSPVNGHPGGRGYLSQWPFLGLATAFALDLCSLLGVKALGVKGNSG